MAGIVNEQITAFLETLGKQYPHNTKLTLLGGSALCLLGSPRPTMDIDYVGSDLQKNDFQRLMDEIANDMGLDVEAVPIHELTPLSYGEEKRAIHDGILSGKTRKTWPKEGKLGVIGRSLDGRTIGVICRLTQGGKVRVITVYQDQRK